MTDPVAPDGRQAECQLDMFRDLPEGRLFLLLAVLEHEAMKAAARGRVRDAIRELSELREELAGAATSTSAAVHILGTGKTSAPERPSSACRRAASAAIA